MAIRKTPDAVALLLALCGAGLLWYAYPKFATYIQTGYAFHRHSKSIPFDSTGAEAAFFYGIYVLAGVFILASGLRRLLFTR